MGVEQQRASIAVFTDLLHGQGIPEAYGLPVPAGLVIARKNDVIKDGELQKKITTRAVFLFRQDGEQQGVEGSGALHVVFFCHKGTEGALVGCYAEVPISYLCKDPLTLANAADDRRADHQPWESYAFAYTLLTGRWPIRRDDGLLDPVDEVPVF